MRKFLFCLLLLLIPIVVGCASQAIIQEDIPQFTSDEVMAIVKRDLLEQQFQSTPIIDSSISGAVYKGQGKWSGRGEIRFGIGKAEELLGRHKYSYLKANITWNFYEKSQTVEITHVYPQH